MGKHFVMDIIQPHRGRERVKTISFLEWTSKRASTMLVLCVCVLFLLFLGSLGGLVMVLVHIYACFNCVTLFSGERDTWPGAEWGVRPVQEAPVALAPQGQGGHWWGRRVKEGKVRRDTGCGMCSRTECDGQRGGKTVALFKETPHLDRLYKCRKPSCNGTGWSGRMR